jgi:hypothetical protein
MTYVVRIPAIMLIEGNFNTEVINGKQRKKERQKTEESRTAQAAGRQQERG